VKVPSQEKNLTSCANVSQSQNLNVGTVVINEKCKKSSMISTISSHKKCPATWDGVQPSQSINYRSTIKYVPFHFKAVIFFLFISNIFDMKGIIGVKYLSYLFAVTYSFFFISYYKMSIKELLLIFTIFILWPFLQLYNGIIINDGNIKDAVSQITPFFAAVVMIFLLKIGNPLYTIRLLYNSILLVSIIVILINAAAIIYPDQTVNYIGYFNMLSAYTDEYIGIRQLGKDISEVGWMIPRIYFSAILFCVPALVYFVNMGCYLKSLLLFTALYLSFSKAGIFVSMLFLIFFAFSKIRYNFIVSIAILFIISVIISSFPNMTIFIYKTILGETYSSTIRYAHLISFINHISQNIFTIIFGDGLGTVFYTFATNEFVTKTELEHINIMRIFGLPWMIIFNYFVVYLSINMIRNTEEEIKGIGYSLLASLIVASTNPLLITPLFMFILVTSYYIQRNCDSVLAPV